MTRLLFLRATGLGNVLAEAGQVYDVDPAQVRDLLLTKRAVPAPGEEAPALPSALTTESLGPSQPNKGKK